LESDFLAIYRIKDWRKLDAPKFFRLAYRCSAYPGVMSTLIQAQQNEKNGGGKYAPIGNGQPAKHVEATQGNLKHHPAFAGVISKYQGD